MFFMPQHGSVKNFLNVCLHCTGVSCEGGANNYFRFPNHLLVISWRTLTEACAAFRASKGSPVNVFRSMEDVAFYLGISMWCLSNCWFTAFFKFPAHCFTAYSSVGASVKYRYIHLCPAYHSAPAKEEHALSIAGRWGKSCYSKWT